MLRKLQHWFSVSLVARESNVTRIFIRGSNTVFLIRVDFGDHAFSMVGERPF